MELLFEGKAAERWCSLILNLGEGKRHCENQKPEGMPHTIRFCHFRKLKQNKKKKRGQTLMCSFHDLVKEYHGERLDRKMLACRAKKKKSYHRQDRERSG